KDLRRETLRTWSKICMYEPVGLTHRPNSDEPLKDRLGDQFDEKQLTEFHKDLQNSIFEEIYDYFNGQIGKVL
ncbi:hypothetical protein R0K05_23750, partial [Planococcus sp. SIMBA_160]